MKDVFISSSLQKKATASVFGYKVDIPLSGMAKGCIGVMMVFGNAEDAEKHGSVIEASMAIAENE